ncbi:ORC-CDC6 family AAA ATPase, partial [Staphylococcus aureus]|uniref:ORC-CDC6 family AAA ATPase n=1 Tax=Staphylococcus aureus TaxID=1280 RepID=UPI003D7C2449
NLLSLLKHIYRRSSFAGENPFVHGPISVSAQVQGIQDAAEWFWEDAQPDAHGTLVRNAVEHLATLLRSVRYSESPSECDLCCFSVN